MLIAVHSHLLMSRRRRFAFDPLNAFWAGVLVCYVLQPVAHGRLFLDWQGPHIVTATTWWITFALLFVTIGYSARTGSRLGRALPGLPTSLRPNRLFVVSLLLIGVGVVGYAYQFASAGGLRAWAAVARGGTDWVGVSAYIAELADFVPLGASLLLFHVELHSALRNRRLLAWLLAAFILVWFFYLGSRSHVITQGLAMLAAYYLPRRRQPRLAALAAGFFVLLLVVNFQQTYRGQFQDFSLSLGQIDWREARSDIIPMFAETTDPAADLGVARGIEFNCVMTVIDLVPSHVPYNYGYPFLEIFTRWIPRAAWPDKVYPGLEAVFPIFLQGGLSDVWVQTSKEPLLMGPALTFVGHYWAMGGPLALVLAGLLTGVMFRMIRTLYERNPGSEGDVILYANLIIIGFTEAAATPFVWIYSLPLTMLPVVVLLRFCRRTSVRQDTSRQRISWKGAARVGTRSSVPGTASKRQGATPQGAR